MRFISTGLGAIEGVIGTLSVFVSAIIWGEGTDPLSGGGGWLGAGLLGMVLAWYLLVRTPANDKMIKELTELFAATVKDISKEFKETVNHLTDKNNAPAKS